MLMLLWRAGIHFKFLNNIIMKTIEIDSKEFCELSQDEYLKIEGGSEFSEACFHIIGAFCKGLYECAVSQPIRPSQYR